MSPELSGRLSMPGPEDTHAAEGAALVRERSGVEPEVALVLGSGLGEAVASDLVPDQEFVYGSLPGFPPPAVPGHAGRLVLGTLYGARAAVFHGRVHFYEGHGMASATLIPRLAAGIGVHALILTNAAGGLDRSMLAGELMLIEDHLNLMGVNPLVGWRMPLGGPAFVDLSAVYDRRLIDAAEAVARARGIQVRRGVYAALPGPSYETPAERVMLAGLGADAVGMSTVPEAAAAAALGMQVLAIACLTNVAGMPGTHEDVLQAARGASQDLRAILAGVVPKMRGTAGG